MACVGVRTRVHGDSPRRVTASIRERNEENAGLRDQLRALVKLAEIDSRARGIDEQLEGIPAELDERRGAVRALESLVEKQRGVVKEAEALLAQQDADISSRNEALSRAKSKGAKARTMREAEAAERELDAVRRSIKDGETEKERLRERIAQTHSSLEAPEQTLADQKKELEAAEQAAESRLNALRAEREAVVAGRDEFTRKIEKAWLRTYERLRPKLTPVVVEVVGETCTGCRMQMPPQRYIQLVKGKEIMQCQHCMRIVFHRDVIAD